VVVSGNSDDAAAGAPVLGRLEPDHPLPLPELRAPAGLVNVIHVVRVAVHAHPLPAVTCRPRRPALAHILSRRRQVWHTGILGDRERLPGNDDRAVRFDPWVSPTVKFIPCRSAPEPD